MNTQFNTPAKLKTSGMVLTLIGIVTLLCGIFLLANGHDENKNLQFWSSLMFNSIFFLLITLASTFLLGAVALAHGAWIVAYRRVIEAISANVWVFGLICVTILFSIVFSNKTNIYHWLDENNRSHYTSLKQFFLSKPFFIIWSVLMVGLWSFFGFKFRQRSIEEDTIETNLLSKRYWANIKWSAAFVVVFGLSVASTIPWLWIMSIDSHWYSTMFSWYTFVSSLVAGISMIMLWVLYVKRQGALDIVTSEHIHDLGKFMFAFSIFWTYLWFSQFMLIWYANISEETVYFVQRMQGPYKVFFFGTLILNFVMPILILMSRPSKRNTFTISFMAIIIILGHWFDFYQMVAPGVMGENWTIGWFEIGICAGFVGIFILRVSSTISKAPTVPVQNPLIKETLVHIS